MITISREPDISIGILSEKHINFELHGDFKSPGLKQSFSGRFSAEVLNDKILIKRGTEKLEVTNEIIFKPQEPGIESFLIKDVTIGIQFHWQRKEKQRFSGLLKLLKEDGKITVINIIPLENYLTSVISSEMSSKSALQLLMAHSIVSRSWILSQIIKSKTDTGLNQQEDKLNADKDTGEIIKWYNRDDHTSFDVCADDHCQRYQGITKIFTDMARRAVEHTKGLVLINNDTICDTRYSKACGGVTESFENVWEPVKHEYLSSIIDYKFEPENYNLDFSKEENAARWIKGNPAAFCNTNDKKILSQILIDYDQETKDFYRWKIEYTQNELSELIRKKSGINFGDIIDLVPVERGYSSRIIKLKITGSVRTMIIGKELEIRKILSQTHLYSSAIIIEKYDIVEEVPQRFIIRGAGWGHGAGMCQIGAAVMAERGHLFDEILLHYFKNARLKKIY
ncbi:MAG: SpoIID/LytB domain-containing protein [Ignavibacteriaceae bacterium]